MIHMIPRPESGRRLLREWLKRNDQTPVDLARGTNIALGLIKNWLAGSNGPTVTYAYDIEVYTGRAEFVGPGVPMESWVRKRPGRRQRA